MHENFLYLEFFWSVFSRIRTECGPENLRIRDTFHTGYILKITFVSEDKEWTNSENT